MSAEGPFGGPRPLLNLDCTLKIKHAAAGAGKATQFSRVSLSIFNRGEVFIEKNGFNPDSPTIELATDRVTLAELQTFMEDYSDELGISSSDLTLSVETEIEQGGVLPRPFAESEVGSKVVIETTYPRGMGMNQTKNLSQNVVDHVDIFNEYVMRTDNSVVFVTSTDTLADGNIRRLVDIMEGITDLQDVVVTCSVGDITS